MGLFGDADEGEENEEEGGFEKADKINATHRRVIDEEAGFVLYTGQYHTSLGEADGYGLAAVPLSETDLTIEDAD